MHTYIDAENTRKDITDLDKVLLDLLKQEIDCEEKDGKIYVRLDKIARLANIYSAVYYTTTFILTALYQKFIYKLIQT